MCVPNVLIYIFFTHVYTCIHIFMYIHKQRIILTARSNREKECLGIPINMDRMKTEHTATNLIPEV